MRVLYITDREFDSPRQGSELRDWAIAHALEGLGHVVSPYFLAGYVPKRSAEPVTASFMPVKFLREDLRVDLTQLIASRDFDIVILTHPLATEIVLICGRFRIPCIVNTHNFEGGLAMKKSFGRSVLAQVSIALGEALYLRRASQVWVVSESDAAHYRNRYVLRNVHVVPNVIRDALPADPSVVDPATVLFVATFSYPPNAEAAEFLIKRVLPLLRDKYPKAKLLLVGREHPQWICDLQDRSVEIHRNVPDISPFYRRATVVAVPLFHGGGTKFKVVEALAYAKVVVATDEAVRGLDLQSGVHYLSASTADAFATEIFRAFEDDKRRDELGSSARSAYEKGLSLETLRAVVDVALESALRQSEDIS